MRNVSDESRISSLGAPSRECGIRRKLVFPLTRADPTTQQPKYVILILKNFVLAKNDRATLFMTALERSPAI